MPTDTEISEHANKVRSEFYSKVPFTSIKPLSDLFSLYKDSRAAELKKLPFTKVLKCRGDGNCFYRAFLAGLNGIYLENVIKIVEKSGNDFKRAGFEPIVYEDFIDVFIESKGTPTNTESNSNIVLLRFLTSVQMKLNPSKYQHFLEISLKTYCEKFVEAFGQEAEHIQIVALCDYLKIGVEIWCLEIGGINRICIGNDGGKSTPFIQLLYTPGHYDLLLD